MNIGLTCLDKDGEVMPGITPIVGVDCDIAVHVTKDRCECMHFESGKVYNTFSNYSGRIKYLRFQNTDYPYGDLTHILNIAAVNLTELEHVSFGGNFYRSIRCDKTYGKDDVMSAFCELVKKNKNLKSVKMFGKEFGNDDVENVLFILTRRDANGVRDYKYLNELSLAACYNISDAIVPYIDATVDIHSLKKVRTEYSGLSIAQYERYNALNY